MKIVVVSGGFDPIHSGHIHLFNEAAKLGDKLIVGVNSDEWLTRKKGRPFMPFFERANTIKHLNMVDDVLQFNDSDDTARDLLKYVKNYNQGHEIIFANGGDRTKDNIPEMDVKGVEFVWGVGGENKANSSSWILEEWQKSRTVTRWGYYDILEDSCRTVKVKELVVNPGGALSYQSHNKRSELWFVKSGYGKIIKNTQSNDIDHNLDRIKTLKQFDYEHIDQGTWHQLINDSKHECLHIVEVQYGTECVEEDIISE